MKTILDFTKYFKDFPYNDLWRKTSAVAHITPQIIAEELKVFNVVYLEKNLVSLEDHVGSRWKVCCSRNNKFDISPSYTKGCGRSKDGVNVESELEKYYQGVIFVSLFSKDDVQLTFKKLQDLDLKENLGKITL